MAELLFGGPITGTYAKPPAWVVTGSEWGVGAPHGTTGPWSCQGAPRAPPPASHFTDEDACTWLPYIKCLLYTRPMVLACYLLSHPVLTTTKYGPGLATPVLQEGKQRPREVWRLEQGHPALPTSGSRPLHIATPCVFAHCAYEHTPVYVHICVEVGVHTHASMYMLFLCMSSTEPISQVLVHGLSAKRAGWRLEPFPSPSEPI